MYAITKSMDTQSKSVRPFFVVNLFQSPGRKGRSCPPHELIRIAFALRLTQSYVLAGIVALSHRKPLFVVDALETEQVVVIVVPSLATINDDLLLLVLRHGVEEILELGLGDLLAQLARLREHDEAVLDVVGALLLDEADAAQAVGRFGVQDLVEGVLAGVVLLSEGITYVSFARRVAAVGAAWE